MSLPPVQADDGHYIRDGGVTKIELPLKFELLQKDGQIVKTQLGVNNHWPCMPFESNSD